MDKNTIWGVKCMDDGSINIYISVDEVNRLIKEGEPSIHKFALEVVNSLKWATDNGRIKARGSEYRNG